MFQSSASIRQTTAIMQILNSEIEIPEVKEDQNCRSIKEKKFKEADNLRQVMLS
jgi:hypothetical protein